MSRRYEQIVTLDFETYFAKDYSLRSKTLNTSEYIRNEQFKAQCVGIKIDQDPVVWYKDCDIAAALSSIEWDNAALLAHNCAFDGLILSHHYGIRPAYYLDTLSMARALHSNGIGAGLDEVARFYRLGNKLPDVLNQAKGVRDLPDDLMVKLGQYCAVDVELCRMIFDKMVAGYPKSELDLISMTVRMFCEPVLRIDMDRVRVALDEEMAERAALIEASGQPIAVLSSAAKFAAALEELGVEVPTKVSVRTDQETYAFAKSDLEFTELKQHPDERVRRLVAGRLAAKSTIGETRAVRFLQAGANGNRLPVLLQYYRAHTGRWSAGNKMNLQNLKRKGELRRSILAPEGHVIAVADSAQIEVRMLAWLARDQELLEIFTSGADPYKHMAAQIYGKPIDQITKDERFIGKIAVLGLGYGMGWQKFRDTLAAGAMGPPVQIDDHEAQRIVRTYRAARSAIVRLWRDMDALLAALATRREMALGPLKSDGECRVWLPNGLYLQYPFIRGDVDEDGRLTNFRYFDYSDGMAIATNRKLESDVEVKRIYGGLMTENVVQALARIVVGEQMLIIDRRLKDAIRNEITNTFGRVVTMTHDEVVCVVPAQRADELSQMMIDEMSVAPLWCQGVTLSAEGGYDVNYSK